MRLSFWIMMVISRPEYLNTGGYGRKEGENTEISLFKSECTEYNIWVETFMGEANEDSKIIKIDDK